MVHCRTCGQTIAETANTCPHCGATQAVAGAVPAALPRGIRGWSWGAFLLNWFWGLFNGTWIALLCLIPGVGFVMAIVLGFKGREWAWRNRRWDSVEHFNRVQRRWSIGALVVWLLPIAFFLVTSLIWPDTFETRSPSDAVRVSIDPPVDQRPGA